MTKRSRKTMRPVKTWGDRLREASGNDAPYSSVVECLADVTGDLAAQDPHGILGYCLEQRAMAMLSEIRYRLAEHVLPVEGEGSSPIERALLAAMLTDNSCFRVLDPSGQRVLLEYFDDPIIDIIQPQAMIGQFRVDFLIRRGSMIDGSVFPGAVVVECDGHDFHERTKEQAKRDRSRDRALQQLGFTVFRFTGSEIWANPHACVAEVRKFLRALEKAGE